MLQGAEILFYPTAIGSEPQDQELDSRDHWKRVMQGHAGANLVRLSSLSLCLLENRSFVLLKLTTPGSTICVY